MARTIVYQVVSERGMWFIRREGMNSSSRPFEESGWRRSVPRTWGRLAGLASFRFSMERAALTRSGRTVLWCSRN